MPARINTMQGFKPMFNPQDVVDSQGKGAMYPFTREFYHPDDLVSQCTPAAATRFYQDDRRFLAPAYDEGSLFWRGADWRTPLPMERLQMMGWPAGAVDHVEGPALKKRQVQISFIGNGFHLPTLLAVLCFLPGLMASKIPPVVFDPSESNLRERLLGTVWEPERLEAFPGLLTVEDLVSGMSQQLHPSRSRRLCGTMWANVCKPATSRISRRIRRGVECVASIGLFWVLNLFEGVTEPNFLLA